MSVCCQCLDERGRYGLQWHFGQTQPHGRRWGVLWTVTPGVPQWNGQCLPLWESELAQWWVLQGSCEILLQSNDCAIALMDNRSLVLLSVVVYELTPQNQIQASSNLFCLDNKHYSVNILSLMTVDSTKHSICVTNRVIIMDDFCRIYPLALLLII